MGGFMVAIAMEKWNLHRRIALSIIRLTGTNANGIFAGIYARHRFSEHVDQQYGHGSDDATHSGFGDRIADQK
jgi:hypothetical protein